MEVYFIVILLGQLYANESVWFISQEVMQPGW